MAPSNSFCHVGLHIHENVCLETLQQLENSHSGSGERPVFFFFFLTKSKPAFIFKPPTRWEIFKVWLLNFTCWPISNDIRKTLHLKCLNTEQRIFEDE